MVDRDETKSTDEVGPEDGTRTDGATGGRMLTRRWTIAACFRAPVDYGIPTAPTFHTERCESEVVFRSEGGALVLRARSMVKVRR